jgi:hypothetical protein
MLIWSGTPYVACRGISRWESRSITLMIRPVSLQGSSRRVIGLTAVLALLFNALLIGVITPKTSSIVSAGAATVMTAAAHLHINCPDDDRGSEPAEHNDGDHHRRFCCILCGKVGAILGLGPILLGVLIPLRAVATIKFSSERPEFRGSASVLPVGARAPPRLD